ncbi:deoxyribodipyrimidine photolyase [Thiocapsa imhoffii]|uniref:Deoxyribodipyrimidine photolyase n=1 Tax=Thiocapsa imhoffii TaxID=382777 RepID=A0A9X0WKK1_9GAMM|nr:FAD-dependent oxidoreductase [Thiocapsa imhoffii]MBK1646452.1 deoxyribodipyrimidine photolyase [Thiocapsa imhoffii]
MNTERIAIIGSGMTGLACARKLTDAGYKTVVIDKGRGVGGRLSTRRTRDGWQFDHGAQYMTASSPVFQTLLEQAMSDGAAAEWADGGDRQHIVGVPGMSGLASYLSRGIEIRQGVEVAALQATARGWALSLPEGATLFDRVVVTVPAPQLSGLLGPTHPITQAVAEVRLVPCLTLMAVLAPDFKSPFISEVDSEAPLAWIAHDSSKPGRAELNCWVAQASASWSAAHLECDPDAIVARMLPLLCARLSTGMDAVRHAAAHRWRYARVTVPLGRPFVRDPSGTLYAGGDWCLGARVEAAWTSGEAIARSIIEG